MDFDEEGLLPKFRESWENVLLILCRDRGKGFEPQGTSSMSVRTYPPYVRSAVLFALPLNARKKPRQHGILGKVHHGSKFIVMARDLPEIMSFSSSRKLHHRGHGRV